MIADIDKNRNKIAELCRQHSVKSLYLFGSATRKDFTTNSDFDFLVRFSDTILLLDYADNYFNLLEKLKQLLNRNVDLLSEKALKNPVLIKEINKTKVAVYES